jgi:hypothetical protein
MLFMFDYNNLNLPVTFQNLWRRNFLTRNADDAMALRNDNDFYVPLCRLESYKKFCMNFLVYGMNLMMMTLKI